MSFVDERQLSSPMVGVGKPCLIRPRNLTPVRLRTTLHNSSVFQPLRVCLALLTIISCCGLATTAAVAQTNVNDVHVAPRTVENSGANDISKASLVAPSLNTHVRPLKSSVDLVLVPVTITDPMNRLVTGLEKENFELFEGGTGQEIKSFSSEDAPVSLGVILS